MKKYISTFLVAVLCLAFSISAGATNVTTNNQGLTEDNIKHVDIIFENKAHVIDVDGTNITSKFIEENKARYQAGSYNEILDCLIDQNLAIEEQPPVSPLETRLVVNGSVKSSSITRYFKSPLTGTTTKEWITFYFIGHYRVNDYNNTIDSGVKIEGVTTAKSSSTLDKICFIDTSASSWKITNNNKKITFTVKYSARIYTSPFTIADQQNGTTTFSKTLS